MAQLLLVEDDAPIRDALIRALSGRGHVVTSTPAATAALQHVLKAPPDAVLLDLGLPDLGGQEALRMIRSVSTVPVLIITARDDEARSSGRWTRGRTTTSLSRSAETRSRPGSGQSSGGQRRAARGRGSRLRLPAYGWTRALMRSPSTAWQLTSAGASSTCCTT